MNRVRTQSANVALGALAVLALGLAVAALSSAGGSGGPEDGRVAASPASVTPSAVGDTARSEVPAVDTVRRPPRQAAVDVVSDTVVWRAGAQRCDRSENGVLDVTVDGGSAWQSVEFPLREVLAIDAADARDVTLHGLDATCVFASVRSSDGGRTWQPLTDTGRGVWTYSPRDALRAGGVPVDAPCARLRDVASADRDAALALCDGGVLKRADDAASGFVDVGTAPGAVAVASDNGRLVFAAVITDACPGLRVDRSNDGGATWTAGDCIDASATDGPIGLTLLGSDVVLVSPAGTVRVPEAGAPVVLR